MKKSLNPVNIILTLLIIPFLWSCNNLFSNDEQSQKEYVVSGSFYVNGSVPSGFSGNNSISCSALPAYIASQDLFYNINALLVSDSTIKEEGSVSGNNFSVTLSKTGIWILTVEGFSDSGKTEKVYSGSLQVTIDSKGLVDDGVTIVLNPIKSGSGKLALVIDVDSDSGIKSMKANLVSVPGNESVLSENFETFPAEILKDDIASGSYTLSLSFYDKKESEDDKNLIYAAQETVNVFANLKTDCWQGGSEYIKSGGDFTVTKENVDNFARTTFFVQGASGTYAPKNNASDTNTGTYFDPYASVQKACDRILEINDESSIYTIYVDGIITAQTEKSVADFSSLDSSKKLNIHIIGLSSTSLAELHGNPDTSVSIQYGHCASVIELGVDGGPKKINAVLKNLIITEGRTYFGGGIRYYSEDLTYTLEISNCIVRNNYGNFGGGMMIQGGLVVLTDGTVFGDKSFVSSATSSHCSNMSSGNGGAITVNGHNAPTKLVMKEGTYVCGNYTSGDETGGGVHVQRSAQFTMEQGACVLYNGAQKNGGGIFIDSNKDSGGERDYSKIDISGSVIGNISGSSGGGIYADTGTTVTLTGATVSGNSAADSGGGIYFRGSELNIDADSKIGDVSATATATVSGCSNKAKNGGGIYIDGGTADIQGSVLYNYASNAGGGICGKGTVTLKGDVSYNYAKDGGGVCAMGGIGLNAENATIKNNKANIGGGIYADTGSTVTLTGATASGNSADSKGGGIYAQVATTVELKDSVISDNIVTNGDGGGVYCETGVVMSGGEIKGNSVGDTGKGNAVYVCDTFKMSGPARIDRNNDVYLPSAKTIKISGALTGDAPVATITPEVLTEGTVILSETTTGLLSSNYKKFIVFDTNYIIKSDGKLYQGSDIEYLTSPPVSGDEVYCRSQAGLQKLAGWVQDGKGLGGVTIHIDDDIVCTGDFTPIGGGTSPDSNKFSGTIDGDGHTISGIDLTNATTYFKAFVPYLSGGKIKNLTLEGVSSSCAFTSRAANSTIENCVNKIKITNSSSSSSSIGGFCGVVQGNLTIKGCTNNAAITSSASYVGGIIGHLSYGSGNTFSELINKGSIKGKNFVGGIVGAAFSSVINSANYGSVEGSSYVGGIAGNTDCSSSSQDGMKNCHNSGSVKGASYVGGIVGCADISSQLNYNAYIQNCYNDSEVSLSSGSATTIGYVLGGVKTDSGSGNFYMTSTYYVDKGVYTACGVDISPFANAVAPVSGLDVTGLNDWVTSNGSSTYSAWTDAGKFVWE